MDEAERHGLQHNELIWSDSEIADRLRITEKSVPAIVAKVADYLECERAGKARHEQIDPFTPEEVPLFLETVQRIAPNSSCLFLVLITRALALVKPPGCSGATSTETDIW